MKFNYRVISADSHLEIPAERWAHRIPPAYREFAPKRVRLEDGTEAQVVGDRVQIQAGRSFREVAEPDAPDSHQMFGGSYDDKPGAGTPEQRLREQDVDGVDAELLFPGTSGVTSLLREVKSDAAYAAMVSAYNDWLTEEYCAVEPQRLVGIGLIPDLDASSAVAELQHCAELGLKAIQLNSLPGGAPYPTPEDDIFWAAALDAGIAVTIHVCFGRYGGRRFDGPYFKYPRVPEGPVKESFHDPLHRFLNFGAAAAANVIPLIYAGVFDRFPGLRLYFAETEIGWVPQWLERADDAQIRYGPYLESAHGLKIPDRLPSDYVTEHVLWGTMRNPYGIRNRYEIGIGNIMWESDFPHPGTNWPNSQKVIDEMFENVPAEERYRMLAGNAVEFFKLT